VPSVSLSEMVEQPRMVFSRRELMSEVRHYLVAVDAFRAEGREPQWLREAAAPPPALRRRRRSELPAVHVQGGKHGG
jgi:hypothetical protein